MKKLFLIVLAVTLLTFMGCNPITSSGNGFDNLVRIKNFDKYTALGVGNKNTARSARSLTTDYLTTCGLFGQNPDGTYELIIFEDEQGHDISQNWNLNSFDSYDNFIFCSFSSNDEKLYNSFLINNSQISNYEDYYYYCINSKNGKMYNIGNYFTYFEAQWSFCEPSVNAYIKGRHDKDYESLFRLNFTEDDLLKIEELAKIKTGTNYYTDKFGNIVTNSIIIKAGDTEAVTFPKKNKIYVGYNGYIYGGDLYAEYWVNENGEWETPLFIPTDSYAHAFEVSPNYYNLGRDYTHYKDEEIQIVGNRSHANIITFTDDVRYITERFYPNERPNLVINKYYIEFVADEDTNTTTLNVYDMKIGDVVRIYTLNDYYRSLSGFSSVYKNRIELNNGDTEYPIGIIDSDGILYAEEDFEPHEIYVTPLN